ncbi:MAG: hypothetical protein WCH34_10030 [Bacteroidota bacterium]
MFSSPWFITPKYKSKVVMFPTSTNAISKALLSDNYAMKTDILEFGEDEQSEQMLQILNSNVIRQAVIKKYNLMDHYEIDSNSLYKNTYLFAEYESNISFRRTEYMAVEISVMDKDPQMAANIANDIAELMDSTKNAMQKERAMKGYKIVEAEYNKLAKEIEIKEDSISIINHLGVFHYESQSERLNEQMAIALSKGNQLGIREIQKKLDILAQYGGAYVSLRIALEHDKKQFNVIKTKFDEAKVDAFESIPQKFIVDRAFKAEKKSYPVRWLIVAVSTISSMFFCILILIIIDTFRRYNMEKINAKSN